MDKVDLPKCSWLMAADIPCENPPTCQVQGSNGESVNKYVLCEVHFGILGAIHTNLAMVADLYGEEVEIQQNENPPGDGGSNPG